MTGSGLDLQLLGDVAVRRDGVAQALPASRKCRALLAYLALSPRAVSMMSGRGTSAMTHNRRFSVNVERLNR
jgi:hypothetical protein